MKTKFTRCCERTTKRRHHVENIFSCFFVIIASLFVTPFAHATSGERVRVCQDIFYHSLQTRVGRLQSAHPIITNAHLATTASLKENFEKHILGRFFKTPNIRIDVGAGTLEEPEYFPLKGAMYIPFTSLDVTPDEFENRHGPDAPEIEFDTRAAFLHEYTHAVLHPVYRALIPFYDGIFEFWKDPENQTLTPSEATRRWPAYFRSLRALKVVTAYDEFLADLAPVLFFDDPDAVKTALIRIVRAKQVRLWGKSILERPASIQERQAHRRSFLPSDMSDDSLLDRHALLTPARVAIWKIYSEHRHHVSRAVFFQKAVHATMEAILARLKHEEGTTISYANYNQIVSNGLDAEAINRDLITRLENINFKAPPPR